jgi:DNA-binding Lrp family transcriptional regulator
MVQAYVFIHIGTTDPLIVLNALRQIPEVQEAHVLLGPIDCIAKIACANQEALQETLLTLRGVPGVVNTDTRYVYA